MAGLLVWIQPTSITAEACEYFKSYCVIYLLQHFSVEKWRRKSGNDNNAD